MTSGRFITLIWLGVAVGQIKRGEDGLAIALLCGVAFITLVDWGFAILRERDEQRRKSRQQGPHFK